MSTLVTAIILFAIVFTGYAVIRYYQSTPGETVLARIWGSILVAGASTAAYIAGWFASSPPVQ